MKTLWLLPGLLVLLWLAGDAAAGPLERISHRDKLYDIAIQGQNVLVVGYPGLVLHSANGGGTWSALEVDSRDALFAIDMNDDGRGVVVGRTGLVLTTADGGKSWQPRSGGKPRPAKPPAGKPGGVDQDTAPSEPGADEGHGAEEEDDEEAGEGEGGGAIREHLFDVERRGEHIWAVGHFGTIVHSGDGGLTWERQSYESAFPEDLPEAERGVISEMERENEGAADEARLNAVAFADDRRGWIAGEFGMVLHTDDGGKSWKRQPSASGKLLFALHIVDPQHVMAVGAEGTFMETRDGGQHWTGVDTGVHEHILGLCPVGEDLYLVGRDGLVLIRRGKEGAFERKSAGLYTWLNAVRFLDAKTGFAAGGRGHLLMTTDAGANWQRLSGR